MKALYAAAAVAALVIVAGVIYYAGRAPAPAPQLAAPSAPEIAKGEAPPPAGENTAAAPKGDASFDVVRISPDGRAVIAGRTVPGAEVTVRAGKEVVGTATADARGEWVLVPEKPLPAGPSELRQQVKRPDGSSFASDQVAMIVVPEREAAGGEAEPEALVALTPAEGGATDVLQGAAKAQSGSLAVSTADLDQQGQAVITGQAPPGATVRAYIDDRPVGTAQADSSGTWRLWPTSPLAPGSHRLRVDQLGPKGQVDVRVEVPLSRDEAIRLALNEGRIVVQPGDNLWRIARVAYGAGLRYTTIYQANRGQIRDPDLIYPGQVFELPDTP